ncbi:helix-turn-helix domain-containing protein [Ferrovum myxofaciens]|uniref:helix-turn-helix domain-containing protein n=1 Tax=Ferrovum myxofaciens TaxID=416213 RepID=UPI001D0D554F|nr:helix-turn-helix domain-containing protein [Ferrovum myxofaciens]
MKFGPRPTLTHVQVKHARQLIDQGDHTVSEVAKLLGVHRTTLYRAIARAS